MPIPIGTMVMWEEADPQGRYYPLLLKEGRVADPAHVARADSDVSRKVERLLRPGYVIVVSGVYAIPQSADDVHVLHEGVLAY